MNTLNPELDSQVSELARLCCAVLEREETNSAERAQPLLEALVAGGYARLSDVNLQARLEEAVVSQCRERAIHRREELTGITGRLQSTFNELVRGKTQSPQPTDKSKAANISSATDA